MTEDQRFLAIGIYVNSALFLSGVFVAGLVTGRETAWKLALVAAGLTYVSYLVQVAEIERAAQIVVVLASIIAAVAAGLALFF